MMIPTLKLTNTHMMHSLHLNTTIILLTLTLTIILIIITCLTVIQKFLYTLIHPTIVKITPTHFQSPKITTYHILKDTFPIWNSTIKVITILQNLILTIFTQEVMINPTLLQIITINTSLKNPTIIPIQMLITIPI